MPVLGAATAARPSRSRTSRSAMHGPSPRRLHARDVICEAATFLPSLHADDEEQLEELRPGICDGDVVRMRGIVAAGAGRREVVRVNLHRIVAPLRRTAVVMRRGLLVPPDMIRRH